LFLAALLTKHADEIEIKNNTGTSQRSLTLDIDVLEKLLTHPRNYAVTLQPLSDAERQWLRGLVNNATGRTFDVAGSRGSTLRDRVVEQLRLWIKRLQLPLFAEALTSAQLEKFLPDNSPEVCDAVAVLIQANRNDNSLASALLDNLPATLKAPVERSTWTPEIVQSMLASYTEACRAVEQLPKLLEIHAAKRIAAVFGADQYETDVAWNVIYQWRANRKVVQSTNLPTNPRSLFLQTNNPTGSIKSSLLEEFAK
jgi:hypothetical protein